MDKSKKLQIFCYTHKIPECGLCDDYYHTPLHVGKHNHKDLYVCDMTDNVGDNISHLNEYYREVTGMYWLWKNNPNVEYIGTEHYRRRYNLSIDCIKEILDKTDYIISLKSFPFNLYDQMSEIHGVHPANAIRDIVKELYPEYEQELYENTIYACNCFITPLQVFNDMCNFTFSILNKFIDDYKLYTPKQIDDYINKYVIPQEYIYWLGLFEYQKGIFGFICERLTSIYMSHNFKNRILVSGIVPGLN